MVEILNSLTNSESSKFNCISCSVYFLNEAYDKLFMNANKLLNIFNSLSFGSCCGIDIFTMASGVKYGKLIMCE